MFTALDARPTALDQHEQDFVATVRKYRWRNTEVFEGADRPGFSADNFQIELREVTFDLVRCQREPQQLIYLLAPQSNLPGLVRFWVSIDHSASQGSSSGLQNQLGRAPARPIANTHIGPALEPVGRFGAKIEFLGSGSNRLRFEISALNQNVDGIEIDLAVLTTHDTGQCHRLGFISD